MKEDNDYNDYKNYKGYKTLPFYQQSEIIYDFTVEFCNRYIDRRSRTQDQMVQAGRSGKQNIAEGYLQKSLEGRIKLVGVSRGSLEELLKDYEDYLRQHGHKQWEKNSPESIVVRKIAYNRYKSYNDYKIYIVPSEKAANTMICLINQTNQLLDQKLRWLEEQFVREGGFRENLFKKRLEYRNKKHI
jgi:four helix bundle suffix protein